MELTMALGSRTGVHRRPIRLMMPLAGNRKIDTLRLARDFGLQSSDTWSCFEGGPIPCGKCSPCVIRKENLV